MSRPGRGVWVYSTAGSIGVHLALVLAAIALVPRTATVQAKTDVLIARLAVDTAAPVPNHVVTAAPATAAAAPVVVASAGSTTTEALVTALAPSSTADAVAATQTSAVAVSNSAALPPVTIQPVGSASAQPISPTGASSVAATSSANVEQAKPVAASLPPSESLPVAADRTSALAIAAAPLAETATNVRPDASAPVKAMSPASASRLSANTVAASAPPVTASVAPITPLSTTIGPSATVVSNEPSVRPVTTASLPAGPVAPLVVPAPADTSSNTAAIPATAPWTTTAIAPTTGALVAAPIPEMPAIASTAVATGTQAQSVPTNEGAVAGVAAPTVTVTNLAGRAPMHIANVPPVEPPLSQPTVPLAESLRSFIAGYRGTPCLATEVSVADNDAEVTAFGSAEASRQFTSALQAAFPGQVSARATVISSNQCAAASMVGQWQNSPGVTAGVEIAEAMVENGSDLEANIAYGGGSWVTVFLVDDDGKVTDLSDHLALVDGKVMLKAPVVAVGAGAGTSQLLLAVTSSRELDTLRSPFGGPAAELLPKLIEELNRTGTTAAIGMAAFKVYGAGMTLK